MSAAFLAHYRCSPGNESQRLQLSLLTPWLPFVPARAIEMCRSTAWGAELNMRAWSIGEEAARGSFWSGDDSSPSALIYQGWLREPESVSLSLSVAEVIETLCAEGDEQALDALHQRPGQFALIYHDPHSRLHALSDAFCGQHLYYSIRGDQILISNRAVLIAGALNGLSQLESGRRPTRVQPRRPDALKLAWHLSRYESPLGDPSAAWEEIKLLLPHQRIVIDEEGLTLTPVEMESPKSIDWDELYADLLWRAGQLRHLPDLKLKLALTGGFDSRLVLGALMGAGVLDRVDQIYLRAEPEHSDYIAAHQIAAHYGFPLKSYSAKTAYIEEDGFFSRVKRHNFFSEYMLNAWDLKGYEASLLAPDSSPLPGYYGELYRSHADLLRSHLWLTLRRRYEDRRFIDRHSLLSELAIDHCYRYHNSWLNERQAVGVPANHVLDEAHREARMWRWASQALLSEASCMPSINLLADVKLRASYAKLCLRDRLAPKVHFELLRRVDDQLAWLPFAKHRWPRAWANAYGRVAVSPVKGAGNEINAQIHMWKRERDQICDFLLSPDVGSAWTEIVDHQKLVKRVELVRAKPTPQHVKGLLGATGIKLALERDLVAYQLSSDEISRDPRG